MTEQQENTETEKKEIIEPVRLRRMSRFDMAREIYFDLERANFLIKMVKNLSHILPEVDQKKWLNEAHDNEIVAAALAHALGWRE